MTQNKHNMNIAQPYQIGLCQVRVMMQEQETAQLVEGKGVEVSRKPTTK